MTASASITNAPVEGGLLASTDVAAVLGEIRTNYGKLVRSGRIHGLMICDADARVLATDTLFDAKISTWDLAALAAAAFGVAKQARLFFDALGAKELERGSFVFDGLQLFVAQAGVITGPLYNAHSHSGMPLADAHSCNLSHAVWSYYVALEGSTTYFIDVARGDPSGVEVPVVVKAKVQALNGLEIPVLGETPLPWEAPECNETQAMEWAGDWFGVSASATYNLVVEVSGLASLDPVVVTLTVSKEQAHGNSTPPDTPNEDAGTQGLEVGLEGVMMVGGPCAVALCIVAAAVVGTKHKRAVRGTAGVVERDAPAEGW